MNAQDRELALAAFTNSTEERLFLGGPAHGLRCQVVKGARVWMIQSVRELDFRKLTVLNPYEVLESYSTMYVARRFVWAGSGEREIMVEVDISAPAAQRMLEDFLMEQFIRWGKV